MFGKPSRHDLRQSVNNVPNLKTQSRHRRAVPGFALTSRRVIQCRGCIDRDHECEDDKARDPKFIWARLRPSLLGCRLVASVANRSFFHSMLCTSATMRPGQISPPAKSSKASFDTRLTMTNLDTKTARPQSTRALDALREPDRFSG